jgi:hypothetical protein
VQEKIQAINKEAMGKITSLLDADQKATWKDMTGEPFTVRFDFGGFRRPGTEPKKDEQPRRPGTEGRKIDF